MGFSTLRLVLILAIISVLISCPSCAIKITAGTGDGSGRASVTGEYSLQNSAFLGTDITLGQGAVSRLSSAGGNGENTIIESASGSCGSITNAVSSDGSFRSTNGDFASGEGAVSTYQASLAGSSGSISTTSTGKENEMTVAGGFSGQGDMHASLTSLAAQEALTTGTASAVGTPIFSDELAQEIRGKDLEVSLQGLYLADEQGLGEFGMVAQNAKAGGAARRQPSGGAYKLAGYKWLGDPNIPILLSTDILPEGYTDITQVSDQISSAQAEWDTHSSKSLFSTLDTTIGGTSWNSMDGKNVHLWTDTDLSSNTIAMTGTWFNRRTKEALESDCWYNNNLDWRIAETEGDGSGSYIFDIQTIALHELGHTLGLADLYQDRNSDLTMYGYNDGTADWSLANGDIAGIQTLYGQ
jgi:hypothetical protein